MLSNRLTKTSNSPNFSDIYNNNKYQISYQVSNNESEQRNFTYLIRCQTKSEAIHNIKHVKYSTDQNE
jgi:hypothetical protein